MLLLSGLHATCASAALVFVMRSASPPSFALAAHTSPRATNATFFPSGERAKSVKRSLSLRCSMAGTEGDPSRAIFTSLAAPLAVSSLQMPKSRSKTIVRPSYEIEGQTTRPVVNFVICAGCPPGVMLQMFSGPPRSEAYQRLLPSFDHIGQTSRAPSAVTGS